MTGPKHSIKKRFQTYSRILTAFSLTVLTAVAAGCASRPAAASSVTDETAELRAIVDEYQRALRESDGPGYGALFAQDASRMPPGGSDEIGQKAIEASQSDEFETLDLEVKHEYIDVQVYGDHGHLISHANGTVKPLAGGELEVFNISVIYLFKKNANKWEIYRLMWNNTPSK